MKGKDHPPHHPPHKGKHHGVSLDATAGTVTLALDTSTAKDLLQALTVALSGGSGKGKLAVGRKKGGGSK
ncbi:MAG TPA: hypothetical protein VLX28_15730 [Thermoanaerobaculia bacterium]|nr:hypothetical protein [Thermoanaerobaculia bacterium]